MLPMPCSHFSISFLATLRLSGLLVYANVTREASRLLRCLLRSEAENLNLTSKPASERFRVEDAVGRKPHREGSFDLLLLQDLIRW